VTSLSTSPGAIVLAIFAGHTIPASRIHASAASRFASSPA